MTFKTLDELYEWVAEQNGQTVEEYNAQVVFENDEASSCSRNGYVKTPIPQNTRIRIFCRDLHQCQYCGARNKPLCVDHIHPERHGGDLSDENLITSCRPCNSSKGAKTGKALQKWKAAKKKQWGQVQ